MSDLKIITSDFEWNGKKFKFVYKDADNFEGLEYGKCKQCYGVCFCGEKIVIGQNFKGHWSLIGGTVEKDETFEETLRREIQEESNMKVLKFKPIGYQRVFNPNGEDIYQLRFICEVEPYGEFVIDPVGSVKGIKLIDPLERALELKINL